MNELLEIVFENVPKSNLIDILNQISGSYINFNVKDEIVYFIEKIDSINQIVDENEYTSMNLNSIHLSKVKINKPSFLILYYSKKFDININFYESDIFDEGTNEIELRIMSLCNEIRTKNGVENVFFGLEPASDVETRFFTNNKLGPLKLIIGER